MLETKQVEKSRRTREEHRDLDMGPQRIRGSIEGEDPLEQCPLSRLGGYEAGGAPEPLEAGRSGRQPARRPMMSAYSRR